MTQETIQAEIELLRAQLLGLFSEQMLIINETTQSIAPQNEAMIHLRRLAAMTMNAESGVRSWRQQSGIVPHIPPMPDEVVEAGQHPLATFDERAVDAVKREIQAGSGIPLGAYVSDPSTPCEHGISDGVGCMVCDTDGAAEAQGIETSPRDSSKGESGGESTTGIAEPSASTVSPTTEASGKASDSPAPEKGGEQ